MFKVWHADFRHGLHSLDDNAVSLILTDPPWEHEALSYYHHLGMYAAQKLVHDGELVVLTGGLKDAEIKNILSQHLKWHWNFTFHLQGSTQIVHTKNTVADVRTAMRFVKKTNLRPRQTKSNFCVLSGKDKRHHRWGQPVELFDFILRQLVKRNDVVVDPFLGGGACGIAALQRGCHFIGFERDKEFWYESNERIHNFYHGREDYEEKRPARFEANLGEILGLETCSRQPFSHTRG